MFKGAGEQVGHRLQARMRMRRHVDPGLRQPAAEMVQEDETADAAPFTPGQGTQHLVFTDQRSAFRA